MEVDLDKRLDSDEARQVPRAEIAVAASGPRALGLGTLREANFRWLIGAQWTSLIGDYMVLAALPFAVFAIGGSATQVGIAFGADAAALLLLVLLGGVLGDR